MRMMQERIAIGLQACKILRCLLIGAPRVILQPRDMRAPMSELASRAQAQLERFTGDIDIVEPGKKDQAFKKGRNDEDRKLLLDVLETLPAACRSRLSRLTLCSCLRPQAFQRLAAVLPTLDHLLHLDLWHCAIGSNGAVGVASALPHLPQIAFLGLGANGLQDEGFLVLSPALLSCPSLTALDLAGNEIGEGGVKAIAASLPSLRKLRHLNLSYSLLRPSGFLLLSDALRQMDSITQIDLAQNRIGQQGLGPPSSSTTTYSFTQLRVLSLRANSFGVAGIDTLGHLLTEESILESFDFSCNHLKVDQSLKKLSQYIVRCSHLTELDISSCDIEGGEGLQEFAFCLASCKQLRRLAIGSNNLNDVGIITICRSLSDSQSLTSLSAPMNRIGVKGAEAVAESLSTCPRLHHIDLSHNSVGQEGCDALVAALDSSTLTHLLLANNMLSLHGAQPLLQSWALQRLSCVNLKGNMLGQEGIRLLASSLSDCKQLTELSVSQNMVTDEGATLLAAAMAACTALQVLDLTVNMIGMNGAKAIIRHVPHCVSLSIVDLRLNYIGAAGTRRVRTKKSFCDVLLL